MGGEKAGTPTWDTLRCSKLWDFPQKCPLLALPSPSPPVAAVCHCEMESQKDESCSMASLPLCLLPSLSSNQGRRFLKWTLSPITNRPSLHSPLIPQPHLSTWHARACAQTTCTPRNTTSPPHTSHTPGSTRTGHVWKVSTPSVPLPGFSSITGSSWLPSTQFLHKEKTQPQM